jgi:hypothetical protein
VKIKLIAYSFMFLFSHNAFACRCEGTSPEEAVNLSKAIMIVDVLETNTRLVPDVIFGTGGEVKLLEAEFNVTEVLKKPTEDIKIIRSIGSCGMPLTVGKQYYISVPQKGAVENLISVCSGSFEVWSSDIDRLEALRKVVHNNTP